MKRTTDIPADQRALIAVDLGAESCRVSLLRWHGSTPRIELLHRFPNTPVVRDDGSLRWCLRDIETGVDEGMHRCAGLATEGVCSVAIDGWAVDYVRLDESGRPLAEPFCYRDERTVAAERQLHTILSPARMGELTGVQQLRINTVYQLYADRMAGSATGQRWLNLPEYMLTRWGAPPVSEYTNATHTQLIDIHACNWSHEIFAAAGLDIECAARVVPPGTMLGRLTGPLSLLPAFRETQLIAPACHDTASAIAGIPASGDDWAYISSGTWSLVGAVVQRPLNSPAVRSDNFTNLGAVGGVTCFHRNVNGMWLIKQCMEAWASAGSHWTLDELTLAAARFDAPPALLAVDDPQLLLPGAMPERLNAQWVGLGHPPLDVSPGGAPRMVSLILHSLAARYAEVLERVQQHSGLQLKRLFIVGGGSRNALLNRLTQERTGLQVICGAVESSTVGNFAVQLASLEASRKAKAEEAPSFTESVAQWAKHLQA